MGKIRVSDLAKKMGLTNQDLVFKLKSIGARIEDESAEIDTDIIEAILTGKRLHQPREVILRDGTTAPQKPTRRPPQRRTPMGPLRPRRRRTMIQRVESRIKTLPTQKADPEKPEEAAAKTTEEAVATAAPAEATGSPAAEATAPSATPAATAPAATAEQPQRVTARPSSAPRPAAPGPIARRPGRKPRRTRPAAPSVTPEDLRAYRGSVKDIAKERERIETAGSTSRGRRRAERREREGDGGGEVMAFASERPDGPVTVSEGMTVRVFAERLGVKAKDLIQLMMKQGLMATVNQVLDPALAEQLAEEMGIETQVVSFEEEVQQQEIERETGENLEPRAPVVTIMGHVDHGKTSLLDKIRSSQLTEAEAGGITQHIAAYRVKVNDRNIVFLDTPGHEAFTKLRARGAQVTDVVILVVAADDGVMAQTIEAIEHSKAAGVPIVVAVNKIDKANSNPDRVKQELSDQGLMVEEWGGDIISVPVSAITGEGIDTLMEMLLLTADILELHADPTLSGQGVVIEARKEKGRGNVATVLVQSGSLVQGDVCVSGQSWGKIRAMTDDRGKRVKKVGPATPVEVTGFGDLPAAGDAVQVVDSESKARSIAEYRQQEARQKELAPSGSGLSLEQLFARIEEGGAAELPLIVKGDVQGSVEVLRDTLSDLSTEKVKIKILRSGVGAVSTNDITLAAASEAIVIGFNVRSERDAADLASKEGVEVRLYTVIYEVLEDLEKAMTGLLKPTIEEVDLGRAEVRETFKVPRIGTIAGCHVVEGIIPRSGKARLLRDNVVVYEGKISSLRRFKDDASEVRSGFDCGIGLERFQDVKPGDFIEVFEHQEVAATL